MKYFSEHVFMIGILDSDDDDEEEEKNRIDGEN